MTLLKGFLETHERVWNLIYDIQGGRRRMTKNRGVGGGEGQGEAFRSISLLCL